MHNIDEIDELRDDNMMREFPKVKDTFVKGAKKFREE